MPAVALDQVSWKRAPKRVKAPSFPICSYVRYVFIESRFLLLKRKLGDKLHLKLNISKSPIANKYCEGKMKRTLKRGLKGTEIAKRKVEG